MTASEFAQELVNLIAKHGDFELVIQPFGCKPLDPGKIFLAETQEDDGRYGAQDDEVSDTTHVLSPADRVYVVKTDEPELAQAA